MSSTSCNSALSLFAFPPVGSYFGRVIVNEPAEQAPLRPAARQRRAPGQHRPAQPASRRSTRTRRGTSARPATSARAPPSRRAAYRCRPDFRSAQPTQKFALRGPERIRKQRTRPAPGVRAEAADAPASAVGAVRAVGAVGAIRAVGAVGTVVRKRSGQRFHGSPPCQACVRRMPATCCGAANCCLTPVREVPRAAASASQNFSTCALSLPG